MAHLALVKNENTVAFIPEEQSNQQLVHVTQEELKYKDLCEQVMGDMFSIVNAINLMNMSHSPEYLRRHMREELPKRINKALKSVDNLQKQEFY